MSHCTKFFSPSNPFSQQLECFQLGDWKKPFPKATAGGRIPQDGRLPAPARGAQHGRAEPRRTSHRGSVGIQPRGPRLLSLALTTVGAEVQICAVHSEKCEGLV